MPDNQEPAGFRQQVAAKGALTRTLVSIAVFTGYGTGTVSAHTRPVVKAIKAKIADLAPEGLLYACHAYVEGKEIGHEEESFRMARRQAAKAARASKAAGAAAFAGATG